MNCVVLAGDGIRDRTGKIKIRDDKTNSIKIIDKKKYSNKDR